jgi:hypothetical protein
MFLVFYLDIFWETTFFIQRFLTFFLFFFDKNAFLPFFILSVVSPSERNAAYRK